MGKRGTGTGALAALDASPRQLAAFSLAVDQPEAAAAAVHGEAARNYDRARPVLAARLAWREGRLTDAVETLAHARGRAAPAALRTQPAPPSRPSWRRLRPAPIP